MVAKLYPYNFYLRDEWEQARVDFKLLQDFDVDGIEILKLIALIEHIRQLGKPGPTPVKGVRQSDVLQLDPAVVKEMWDLAVLSYHGALEFLHNRCSVVSSSLLPAKAMVLAVSYALPNDESHRQDFESDVERWFWAATFQQTYSQGANTQTVADAKALYAWDSDLHAVPRDVREFKLDSELLQDQTRRNEMLIRGIGCLLAKRGARDWIKDEEISGNHESIDFHHVFASKHLQSIGIGESDLVINLTPIFSSSNQSLRNDPPSVVAKRDDVVRSAVESHFIDWHLFTAGHWNDFLSARSERLEALIYEAVR